MRATLRRYYRDGDIGKRGYFMKWILIKHVPYIIGNFVDIIFLRWGINP